MLVFGSNASLAERSSWMLVSRQLTLTDNRIAVHEHQYIRIAHRRRQITGMTLTSASSRPQEFSARQSREVAFRLEIEETVRRRSVADRFIKPLRNECNRRLRKVNGVTDLSDDVSHRGSVIYYENFVNIFGMFQDAGERYLIGGVT